MVILQEPQDRNLSKAEKAIRDFLNSSPVQTVNLCEHWLIIELDNGQQLEVDIDQVDWARYELRVAIE
jgi:hypothetical protein